MSHFITLPTAIDLTARFRTEKENILVEELQNQGIFFQCETFEREAIDHLLGEEGCTHIRVYMGMDEYLKLRAVLVGVNENDEDLLPGTGNDNKIVEVGLRCPTVCPPPSALNED